MPFNNNNEPPYSKCIKKNGSFVFNNHCRSNERENLYYNPNEITENKIRKYNIGDIVLIYKIARNNIKPNNQEKDKYIIGKIIDITKDGTKNLYEILYYSQSSYFDRRIITEVKKANHKPKIVTVYKADIAKKIASEKTLLENPQKYQINNVVEFTITENLVKKHGRNNNKKKPTITKNAIGHSPIAQILNVNNRVTHNKNTGKKKIVKKYKVQLISKQSYKKNGSIVPLEHQKVANNGKTVTHVNKGTTSLNQNNISGIFKRNV